AASAAGPDAIDDVRSDLAEQPCLRPAASTSALTATAGCTRGAIAAGQALQRQRRAGPTGAGGTGGAALALRSLLPLLVCCFPAPSKASPCRILLRHWPAIRPDLPVALVRPRDPAQPPAPADRLAVLAARHASGTAQHRVVRNTRVRRAPDLRARS